jgi:hypothetical protein
MNLKKKSNYQNFDKSTLLIFEKQMINQDRSNNQIGQIITIYSMLLTHKHLFKSVTNTKNINIYKHIKVISN